MKPEKLWGLFNFYDNELANRDHHSEQLLRHLYEEKPLDQGQLLRHCRWMCEHAATAFRNEYETKRQMTNNYRRVSDTVSDVTEAMEDEFKVLGKAMRWLGYVQGVLSVAGIFTVNELRDHSRGEGKPFEDPLAGFRPE